MSMLTVTFRPPSERVSPYRTRSLILEDMLVMYQLGVLLTRAGKPRYPVFNELFDARDQDVITSKMRVALKEASGDKRWLDIWHDPTVKMLRVLIEGWGRLYRVTDLDAEIVSKFEPAARSAHALLQARGLDVPYSPIASAAAAQMPFGIDSDLMGRLTSALKPVAPPQKKTKQTATDRAQFAQINTLAKEMGVDPKKLKPPRVRRKTKKQGATT